MVVPREPATPSLDQPLSDALPDPLPDPLPGTRTSVGLDGADGALLDTLLREAPVAFAYYGADLRYLRVNRLLAGINGRSIEDHVGRLPSEVLEPGLAAQVEEVLRHVLSTGAVVVEDDFRTSGPDGTRYWQSRWFPSRGADGAVTGVAVLVLDVTGRRLQELELHASRGRAERLQQATAELAAALSVEEVARVVTGIGRSALGAVGSALALVDEDDGQLNVHGEDGPVPLPADPGPTAQVVRAGMPAYLASPDDLAAWLPAPGLVEVLAAAGERAWAIVPLPGGSPRGALRFAFGAERVLDHGERVFCEALAGQAALAVERARLYERQHRTAMALQRSLVPDRPPEVPGLEMAARYLPGSEDAAVGGDWYDVFPLPSGRTALVVGDVMGKGVAAAAGMGRMRSALRALALADESPAAVLTGLDRLVAATEEPEQIVTLVYAVVDPATGLVVAADAGHPPVLLHRAGRSTELLDVGDGATPLGVPEKRAEQWFTLGPGDLLVAFTDGLVESREHPLSEGLDRVQRSLDALLGTPDQPGLGVPAARAAVGHGAGLQGTVDALVEALVAGRARRDDVTVLALRAAGPD
ncbi:MAG: SpoIIE family protein phosphatase [Motilibacteraceae bacterium]